jgi:hypothetical protein
MASTTESMARTTVWLVKPAAPKDRESVARMRRAIEEDAPRRSLIKECLKAARAIGLSGEDTYVFLAYHALLQIEEMDQSHIYLSDIAPVVQEAAVGPAQPLAPAWSLRQRATADLRRCILLGVRVLAILVARARYLWVRAPGYARFASARLQRLAHAAFEHLPRLARDAFERAWELPPAPEPDAHVRWPQVPTLVRAHQRRNRK